MSALAQTVARISFTPLPKAPVDSNTKVKIPRFSERASSLYLLIFATSQAEAAERGVVAAFLTDWAARGLVTETSTKDERPTEGKSKTVRSGFSTLGPCLWKSLWTRKPPAVKNSAATLARYI